MQHQAAMGVFHGLAHRKKKLDALADRQGVTPAIDRHRLGVEILHHEIRPAVGRHAAVKEPRDVGVVEARENLALGEKARYTTGVNAALEDFDGRALLELSVVALGE